jgi:hypothetical protein
MLVFRIQKHEGLDKSIVYLASFANLKGHVKIDEIEITRMIAIKPKKNLFLRDSSISIISNEFMEREPIS